MLTGISGPRSIPPTARPSTADLAQSVARRYNARHDRATIWYVMATVQGCFRQRKDHFYVVSWILIRSAHGGAIRADRDV